LLFLFYLPLFWHPQKRFLIIIIIIIIIIVIVSIITIIIIIIIIIKNPFFNMAATQLGSQSESWSPDSSKTS